MSWSLCSSSLSLSARLCVSSVDAGNNKSAPNLATAVPPNLFIFPPVAIFRIQL